MTIKRDRVDLKISPMIEAAPSDAYPFRMGSRVIKALYPTLLTEEVFSLMRIESIMFETLGAADQLKMFGVDDDVDITAHGADRTITVFNVKALREIDSPTHRPAVTAAKTPARAQSVTLEFTHGVAR